jgi:hypothetical protein
MLTAAIGRASDDFPGVEALNVRIEMPIPERNADALFNRRADAWSRHSRGT